MTMEINEIFKRLANKGKEINEHYSRSLHAMETSPDNTTWMKGFVVGVSHMMSLINIGKQQHAQNKEITFEIKQEASVPLSDEDDV